MQLACVPSKIKTRGWFVPNYSRGVARILGKGVLDYARKARMQNFNPRPLINR